MVKNDPVDGGQLRSGAQVGHWPSSLEGSKPVDSKPQAQPAETVLKLSKLSKSFRSGFLRRKERGIIDVSFEVKRGSVFALLGHNGAGKTTTINCILDLAHAQSGKVEILGQDNQLQGSRARVGYLPERPYFFEHLTGTELLEFYCQLLGLPKKDQGPEIERVLELTGMASAASRRLKKYSKGMLQRIGLAQALLGDPDFLILDEPMSGLDPMGRREVRELLQELKAQGKTILLSSHIVPDVEMLADQIGILREGRLVRQYDLAQESRTASYEIKLQDGNSRSGYREITVDSVDSLREILERCHMDSTPVVGVQTRTSGLEELFLSAHQGKEARS